MHHIEQYSFGKIVVDDTVYASDIKIFPKKVDSSWWRGEGHLVELKDIKDLIDAKPSKVIIGTGYSGCMRVSPDVRAALKRSGIRLYVEKTGKAVELLNTIADEKTVAGLHLTC